MEIKARFKSYFSSLNVMIRAAFGMLIVLLICINYYVEQPNTFLERLELIAYDMRLKATMPSKPDPRVVIIDIDEKSLGAEGHWPWGRDKLALLIKQLFDKYHIKVVGFDIAFPEADDSSGLKTLEELGQTVFKSNAEYQERLTQFRATLDYDQLMADEMKKHAVVLAFAGGSNRNEIANLQLGLLPEPSFTTSTFPGREITSSVIDGYSGNIKILQDAAAAAGHILPLIDFDGVLRKAPLFVQFGDAYYESLAIAVYRTYLDNAPLVVPPPKIAGNGVPVIEYVKLGNTTIPVDQDSAMFIPFRGKTPMFEYISATDIMRGKLAANMLEGKIGLIGTSAQGLLDLRNTPVNEVYPGVEAHANMLSGFLDNNIKQKPENEQGVKVLLALLFGLPLAIALVRLSPLASTITFAATTAVIIGMNMYFWHIGYVLPVAIPLIMVSLLYLMNMAYGFFIESRSKKQIAGLFGTYIPKELVDEIAKDPGAYSMQGETRNMTVLFSDVRNFTSISEGLTAKELTAMMNAYFTVMTGVIQEQRGTIDKYIGDAIMAFWGAPLRDEKHAEHALLSAFDMQKKLKEISSDFVKRGWPALEIGVGLNNGPMNVGDMGSNFRRSYTVMGDAVNLASRLEGLTKEYGVGILVSENIVNSVQIAVYRELDRVRVKGKLEPVSIFEPVGLMGEVVDQTIDAIDRFHRVLDYYRKQRWDDAERLLTPLLHADPARRLYPLYLERIALLRKNPPAPNWDGVFTFTSK